MLRLNKVPILIAFTLIFVGSITKAQPDSSGLRISLLTCGVGEEIWEVFGHTAIRIVDSNKGTDQVYNYGMFNGFEEGFELQFMRGKLLYYVAAYPYANFIPEYVQRERRVTEQLLLMNASQKKAFQYFLEQNLLEENKYYKYDFFYDNCATRIRDAFPQTFGSDFKFGQTIAATNRITFRQIINQYLYAAHVERFGINIILGSPIDKVMNNTDIMFLPDFLRDGIAGATVAGKPIAEPSNVILAGNGLSKAGINWILIATWILALLTICGLFVKKLEKLGLFMSRFLLFLSGFIGCFLIIMWLGTDHQACANNSNIIWALPTNILLAFQSFKKKQKYAVIGMATIIIVLLFHLLKIQELPLIELSPVLLALLLIYGMIYRQPQLRNKYGI